MLQGVRPPSEGMTVQKKVKAHPWNCGAVKKWSRKLELRILAVQLWVRKFWCPGNEYFQRALSK